MLDANLKTQLKAYLEKAVRPIHITAQLDDSASSAELLGTAARPAGRVRQDQRHRTARRRAHAVVRAVTSPGHDIHLTLRRTADGPRIHLAGAGAAAGWWPSVEAGAGRSNRFAISTTIIGSSYFSLTSPELSGRGAGH